MKQNLISCLLVIVVFLSPVVSAALDIAGTVKFARGVVAAQNPQQASRLLGKGGELYVGDNIQTAEKSFVILGFNDGGKITLRPNSNFSINEYINKADTATATFKLHKGGVRVKTGDIAAKGVGHYQMETERSSVTTQHAEYSMRICNGDCAVKNKTENKTVIAYLVKVEGQVNVIREGKKQKLIDNSPLYDRDRIVTEGGSYAVLVYRDEGRMTLQENTEFEIKKYQYTKNTDKDRAIFELFKGGLRVLTGKIGKVKKQNFAINTPVATIGIRGTGFDLLCQGENCQSTSVTSRVCKEGSAGVECSQVLVLGDIPLSGLHTYVWDSEITQTNRSGTFSVKAPQANYIANYNKVPVNYPKVPTFFQKSTVTRPDKVNIKSIPTFKPMSEANENIDNGTYIEVHNGEIELQEKVEGSTVFSTPIILKETEVAYVSKQGEVNRLPKPRDFQRNDVYGLLPSNEVDDIKEVGVYSVLVDNPSVTTDTASNGAQCGIE